MENMNPSTAAPASHSSNDPPESPTDPHNPKRKRLTQACDICRKKKIKCDGGKPSCANCVRLQLACTYLPSNKKRGPRQGYIEMLEKRLDKMEKMLQRSQGLSLEDVDDQYEENSDNDEDESAPITHRSSSLSSNTSGPSTKRPARTPESDSTNATTERTRVLSNASSLLEMDVDENLSSNDVSDYYSYFGNSAHIPTLSTHIPTLSIMGPNSAGAYSNTMGLPSHSIFPNDGHPQQSVASPALSNSSVCSIGRKSSGSSVSSNLGSPVIISVAPMVPFTSCDDELPPKEIVDHLLDTFFEYLYVQMPIIHQATIRKRVKAGTVPKALLLAIMAASARFSNHPAVAENPPWAAGEKYAAKARILVNRSFDVPTLSSVQALVLLSLHEMAQELGLNKEDSESTKNFSVGIDWVERETRRRVFWCAFMIDKFSSSATGRPQALDERDCEVLLPSEDQDWQNDRPVVTEMLNAGAVSEDPTSSILVSQRASMGPFAYLIRIIAILGRVSHYVNRAKPRSAPLPIHPNSEFALLDQALTGWLLSLPSTLRYNPENVRSNTSHPSGGTFFLMHVVYHTVIVLLHRPNFAIRDLSEPDMALPWFKQYLDQSVNKCLSAADSVTKILRDILGTKCFVSTPFMSYATYTVATVHVGNSFPGDGEVAKAARLNLVVHHKILQEMKHYWAMADKLYFMIRDLFSLHGKVHLHQQNIANANRAMVQGAINNEPLKPAEANTTTLPATSEGSISLWPSSKVPVPVRTDSGFVALWQMASMQYQQMLGNMKIGTPAHGTGGVPAANMIGQPLIPTSSPPPNVSSDMHASGIASAPPSPSNAVSLPIELDDYFGQDISGYNFFSDNSLFEGMFAGIPGGSPNYSTPVHWPGHALNFANSQLTSGQISPLPLSTTELERITGMAKQWQERQEKLEKTSPKTKEENPPPEELQQEGEAGMIINNSYK
ncbi:fungal-specific transcription factor domain-containing protein [Endogone sp. FLAS-F59071]|nr:fungal-specific transcription factor domain-containing protein [Endogone sp. FLAS-F59071]|eukprot:RUS22560.1 fungal-specific transcription factor domain-containing protein [Endogone sp. FLAS-F59071]